MPDKRVIKTKNAIKKAFMTLMLQKDISKITVSDIAESALINRSTFYLHYGDVQAVWNEIEREIAQKISANVEAFDINDIYGSTYKMFNSLTSELDDMDSARKFILYSTNSKYIIERLKDIFTESSYKAHVATHPEYDKPEYKYIITFITSGTIDTYIKWSYSDDKGVDLDILCKLVAAATQSIIDMNLESKI